MATSFRGFGAGEHHVHPRLARMRLSHHGLQQPGRQDSRRSTRAARWEQVRQELARQSLIIRVGCWTFPGTRIGQASECFVYWKDPMTNDTWGLNFTSPIDAKQFRECCVSSKIKILLLHPLPLLQRSHDPHSHKSKTSPTGDGRKALEPRKARTRKRNFYAWRQSKKFISTTRKIYPRRRIIEINFLTSSELTTKAKSTNYI